jgi:hypothetical protein
MPASGSRHRFSMASAAISAARPAAARAATWWPHHRAARRGQPAQHGVRVPRVGHGDQVSAVGHDPRPGLLRRRPQRVGIWVLIAKVKITELQNECVFLARRQFHRHAEPAVDVPRPPGARPAEPQAPAAPGPHVALPGQVRHPSAPVPAAQVEHDRDLRRPVDGFDPPQQHRPVRIGGHREGFPALDPAVADPAAAPDQRPRLVVTAPDVPRAGRRDRVPAGAAEQPAERGRAVPAGHAQPRDRPVRPDKRAALTVRDKRVLPQHPRRQHVATPPAFDFAVNPATSSHGVHYFLVPARACADRDFFVPAPACAEQAARGRQTGLIRERISGIAAGYFRNLRGVLGHDLVHRARGESTRGGPSVRGQVEPASVRADRFGLLFDEADAWK